MRSLPRRLPKLEWVLMTPERAAELLLRNTHNRALNLTRLEKMIGDHAAGLWDWRSCVRVVVGSDGEVMDGQKTLKMIVRTGDAQPVILITGVDPAAWLVMDNVQPRSLGQNLSREGVPNALHCAGMTRALWQAEQGKAIGGRESPSQAVLWQLWLVRRDQVEQYATASDRVSSGLKFGSPSVFGAVMVRAHMLDSESAEAFFHAIEHRHEYPAPVGVARFLQHMDAAPRHAGTRRGPDTVRHAAYLVMAFNAYRLGDERSFSYDPKRGFPEMLSAEEIERANNPADLTA